MFNYLLNTFLSCLKSSESYFPNRLLIPSSLQSSCTTLSSFDPYVQHPAHGERHGNILWSRGIPIFHKQTGKPGRVHTFARLFFRQTAVRTRSNGVAAEQRGGALIRTDKFRAWPGIHLSLIHI